MSSLRSLFWFLGTLALLGCAQTPVRKLQAVAVEEPPILLFMSDFGVTDDSVVICKGAMLGIEPRLHIMDISHEVTPYSVLDAARFLAGTTPYYPAGTVFVTVVDPGVGSERKAVVAKSKRGQYFVLPDNGLLTLVEEQEGLEGVREITNPQWMIRSAISSTFHGRDIFFSGGCALGARRGLDSGWAQLDEVGSPGDQYSHGRRRPD